MSTSASTLIAMSPRNRSASESVNGVVDLAPELHRPAEHLGGRRVLAEPVPRLADAGERARLADAPRAPRGPRARGPARSSRSPCGSPSGAARGRPRPAARRRRARAPFGRRGRGRARRSRRARGGRPPTTGGRSATSRSAISWCRRTRSRFGRLAYATSFSVACRTRQRPTGRASSSGTRISASSSCRISSPVASGSIVRSSSQVERDEERRRAPGELAQAGVEVVEPRRDDGLHGGREARARGGRPASPSGSSMPVVSMMKNGLPPARSAISVASASSMRRPDACRARSMDSSALSGSSRSRTAFAVVVPHAGRSSSRLVRASARTSALR